jgi:hypothetical protein
MTATEQQMSAIDFILSDPTARAEMEAAVNPIFVAENRGRKNKNGEEMNFDSEKWDRVIAEIAWEVGRNGNTQATIAVNDENGQLITLKVYPVSVLMFHPENGQKTVCLVFTRFREEQLDPGRIYNAYAVPLGGCFSPETLVKIEDLGALQLGDAVVESIDSLGPKHWTSNPFDGRTTVQVQVDKKGVYYHGKRCVMDGFANKLTEGQRLTCRAICEDFSAIRLVPATNVAASTTVQRRVRGQPRPAEVAPPADSETPAPAVPPEGTEPPAEEEIHEDEAPANEPPAETAPPAKPTHKRGPKAAPAPEA